MNSRFLNDEMDFRDDLDIDMFIAKELLEKVLGLDATPQNIQCAIKRIYQLEKDIQNAAL